MRDILLNGRASILEQESGTIKKSWKNKISIALIYPNTYYIGMSNLGFQTIYKLFNNFENIVCERFFIPANKNKKYFLSIESGRSILDFDIIAFSISYEFDFLNILWVLDSSGFPFKSKERSDNYPYIIAGGCTSFINPEPIAPFIDIFFIGEIEKVICDFIEIFNPKLNKLNNLINCAESISCAYIPSLYNEFEKKSVSIKRAFISNISNYSTYTQILTNNTIFANNLLIEVSRGCLHGCRFCAAGYVYRPARFRELTDLSNIVDEFSNHTKKIGLLGAAVSDLPCLEDLCKNAHKKDINVSFSSLRADALNSDIITTLFKSGVKTATLAPDAGSERLRKVINKGLSENIILDAVLNLVKNGILHIKLYFMIGLPAETIDDVFSIIELCKKIKQVFLDYSKQNKRIGTITISLNCFVPKPFTPFQWVKMDLKKSLKKKLNIVKNGLKSIPNIKIQFENPRKAIICALLSRGNQKTSQFIEHVYKNNENWPDAVKLYKNHFETTIFRHIDFDEELPWDIIDNKINKKFFINEYNLALKEIQTPSCNINKCTNCGIC